MKVFAVSLSTMDALVVILGSCGLALLWGAVLWLNSLAAPKPPEDEWQKWNDD
ncbi:MAG: hypothetical protein ACHQM6_05220 [Candidatus Kapaibacterium sp.]